jgi:hypothetical protein
MPCYEVNVDLQTQPQSAGNNCTDGISAEEGKRLYAERSRRLDDVIALRVPDRVPTAYSTSFWQATYSGISYREAMYDYRASAQAIKKAVTALQPDIVSASLNAIAFGPLAEMIGYRALQWPGHGLPDNRPFQYLDREYLRADEYDDFIEDPSWFLFTRYLPRVAEAYEPLAKLPQLGGLFFLRLAAATRFFADPEITRCFRRLEEAGAETLRMMEHAAALEQELIALGYPQERGAHLACPFDYFADYFRGSKGIMLDLYRNQDKLLAAMDKVIPMMLRAAVAAAGRSTARLAWVPLHWGLDGFMSLAQFKTFFWPPLRKLLVGAMERGLTPLVFWEGHCESRLETIADIPRGKAIYYFEHTDLARAKEVLGDVVCVRGNVPASMLLTGTPDEVTAYCRKLIETVGKGGGFILSAATPIPDEAKPQNVLAMFEAARRFGRYD